MKIWFKYIINRFKFKIKYNADVKSAFVDKNTKLGKKCNISKNTYITKGVEVGEYTYFNAGAGYILVEGNTTIGKYCSIGPNVNIGPGNHPINFLTTHPIIYDKKWIKKIGVKESIVKESNYIKKNKKVNIGNDVWIGMNTIIMPGVNIGNGAIIGAGSIVTKDVPDYAIVGGNPAKLIRYRFSYDIIQKLNRVHDKWWDWNEYKLNNQIECMYNIEKYINC